MKKRLYIYYLIILITLGFSVYELINGIVLCIFYKDIVNGLTYVTWGYIGAFMYGVFIYGLPVKQPVLQQKLLIQQSGEAIIEHKGSFLKRMIRWSQLIAILLFLLLSYMISIVYDGMDAGDAIILLLLILICILANYTINYQKDEFTKAVLRRKDKIEVYGVFDEKAQELYHFAIKNRFLAISSSWLFMMPFLAAACIYLYQHSFIKFLLSFLIYYSILTLYYLLATKKADQMFVSALNQGQSMSVLSAMIRFYEHKDGYLKPSLNVHTYFIMSLYQQQLYEEALYLIEFIIKKKKSELYQYYLLMLMLICQKNYLT